MLVTVIPHHRRRLRHLLPTGENGVSADRHFVSAVGCADGFGADQAVPPQRGGECQQAQEGDRGLGNQRTINEELSFTSDKRYHYFGSAACYYQIGESMGISMIDSLELMK